MADHGSRISISTLKHRQRMLRAGLDLYKALDVIIAAHQLTTLDVIKLLSEMSDKAVQRIVSAKLD